MTEPNRPLFTLLSLFVALSICSPLSKSLAAMVDASGAKYYHQDGLGSVTALSDDTGAIIETYRYDIFGTPAIYDGTNQLLSASAQGNRFLFTGREWIAEANLYDYRNRAFSPVLGRFLQTDPIGFAAGDVNIYGYVFNMPGDFVDPFGLAWSDFPIGMGDAFAGDLTKRFREMVGLEDYYDPCSDEYEMGRKAAELLEFLDPRGWGKKGLKKLGAKNLRKPSKQIRREWEKANNGKPWPKDPATGRNQDVSHKKPLADGGTNDLDNIEPLPHSDHVNQHKQNGDFKRWGARGAR
jgi:RHS repeat-associated protein